MVEPQKSPRKRRITEADRRAAENLKRIWDREKGKRRITQESAGQEMGWSSAQSVVSQYLNARMSLGVVATLKFAKFLGCKPTDIRPDLANLGLEPGDLSIDAIQLAIHWQGLPYDSRRAVANFVYSFQVPKDRKAAV